MPLESIKKKILSESESETEQIRKDADFEQKKILSVAKEKAKEIEKHAMEEATAESERLQRENEAGLEIETKTMLIEARGVVIEKVLQDVVKDARSMLQQDMPRLLKDGAKQFSDALGESFVVRTNSKNRQMVESLRLRHKYDDEEKGFVLESEDGKVSMVISPDSLLERDEDLIRKEISESVFGKERSIVEKKQREKKKENASRKEEGKARKRKKSKK